MEYKVIDVSTWQKNVDWEKVKNDGIQAVIARSSFGRAADGQKDNRFEEHYKGAKAVGLPVGAYHYSYAKNVQEAKEEADFFLDCVKGKTFEYPVAFDIEESSQAALGKKVVTDIIIAFCEKVEAAGYYVMVYTNLNWLTNYIDTDRISKYDTWLAQWASQPTYKGFFGIWQYTSKGSVSGISGNVDMNISYKNYPEIIKSAGLNGFGKQEEEKPVEPEKPQEPSYPVFQKGAKVRVKQGAKDYNGGSLASFVYSTEYTVLESQVKNRVVIGINGKVTAAVRAEDLTTSTSKPQESMPSIKKGDRVRVKQGAKTYNGGGLASFVYSTLYTVLEEPVGNRVVIGINGKVTAAVRAEDLIK